MQTTTKPQQQIYQEALTLRHRRGRKSRRGRLGSIRKDTARKSEDGPRKRTKRSARRQKERATTRRDRSRTSKITVKPGQEKEGALHTEDRQSHQKLDRKERGRGHTGYPDIRKRPREGRKGSTVARKENTRETTQNPKTQGAETQDTRKRTSRARTRKGAKDKEITEGHEGTGGPPKDLKEEHKRKRERDRGRSKRN